MSEAEHDYDIVYQWVAIVPDNLWDQVTAEQVCDDKIKIPGVMRNKILIPTIDMWSSMSVRILPHHPQTRIYYVAVYDCDLELWNRSDFVGKVMLRVIAKNEESHFSQEDQGILELSITMLTILVLFLGQAVWGYC